MQKGVMWPKEGFLQQHSGNMRAQIIWSHKAVFAFVECDAQTGGKTILANRRGARSTTRIYSIKRRYQSFHFGSS